MFQERINILAVMIINSLLLPDASQEEKQKQVRWFITHFKQLESFERINAATFLVDPLEFLNAFTIYREKLQIIKIKQKARVKIINDKRKITSPLTTKKVAPSLTVEKVDSPLIIKPVASPFFMGIHLTILTITGPLLYAFIKRISLPTINEENITGEIILSSQDNEKDFFQIQFSPQNGEKVILEHYNPLYVQLDAGLIQVQTKTDSFTYSIRGGYVLVKENHIVIFATECETASEINSENAEISFKIARANFKKDKNVETELSLRHAGARLKVLKKMESEILAANRLKFNNLNLK